MAELRARHSAQANKHTWYAVQVRQRRAAGHSGPNFLPSLPKGTPAPTPCAGGYAPVVHSLILCARGERCQSAEPVGAAAQLLRACSLTQELHVIDLVCSPSLALLVAAGGALRQQQHAGAVWRAWEL